MIDYLAHVSALRVCLEAIKNSPPPDPADPGAVTAALNAAAHEPGAAMLGALADHLLQYAQPATSKEITILTEAAALFKQGVDILNEINTTVANLQTGLSTPTASGALATYNAGLANLPDIQTKVKNLASKLKTFQTNNPGNWMLPVGQEQDKPVAQWVWRDVFLARRTTAFVASAQAAASTTRQRAFAIGTLAGAAGNLLGSSYLNAVVGGPRRSHELRHRLAAYSVGAWLRDHEPVLAGSLAALRTALTFGQSTPSLPADIKSLMETALQQSYPSGTAAIPNLDQGYKNILEHLDLLGQFTLPALPPPPNNTMASEIASSVSVQDFPVLGSDNIHPSGSGLGTNNPGIGSHESAGAVCEELLLWLVWPPQWWIALDNALGGEGPTSSASGPGVFDDAELITISQSPTAIAAFSSLSNAAMSFWQALAAARTALVLRGLLYPNPDDLSNPTYTQFLSIPVSTGNYPLLPMPSSDDGTAWPTSAVETPATEPSPFAVAATPPAFLTGVDFSVAAAAPTLWVGMIDEPGSGKLVTEWSPTSKIDWTANFDLDADRGFMAPCWRLASGATITSPPVATTTLSYTAI
jgi:hypothetical protein